MFFNSWQFVLFFPAVASLYFALPHRYRWVLLLAASYCFYICWKPSYLVLLVTSTLTSYFAAIGIAKTDSPKRRKTYLIFSLCANLGLLFSFKYFNFLNESLKQVLPYFQIPYNMRALDVILPVGISFYTFKALSYTIEVYRGNQSPERHLGIFGLYISYFPQLIAGPIERPQKLLPQLRAKVQFDYNLATEGLGLIVWGLFEKVVVADRLALIVNSVYSKPDQFNGVALAIATIFFAFQIYCDFSGYSDIAIGAAKVMGHHFMKNFDRPYFASSIAEFWGRWHISLSSWFRDYLYIPLGGNRVRARRFCLNIMLVFLISGLWHGANWTFVIWGALHGLYYILGIATCRFRGVIAGLLGLTRHQYVHRVIKVAVTFIMVCFGWIFFRANRLSDALTVILRLGTGWGDLCSASTFKAMVSSLGVPEKEFYRGLTLIGVLVVVQFLQGAGQATELFSRLNRPVRWLVYILLVMLIFNLGVIENVPFIYFQF